jgi:hypothetical protein
LICETDEIGAIQDSHITNKILVLGKVDRKALLSRTRRCALALHLTLQPVHLQIRLI